MTWTAAYGALCDAAGRAASPPRRPPEAQILNAKAMLARSFSDEVEKATQVSIPGMKCPDCT